MIYIFLLYDFLFYIYKLIKIELLYLNNFSSSKNVKEKNEEIFHEEDSID
jgi:hypothetical protein